MGQDRIFNSVIWVNIEYTELSQNILVDNLGKGIIWGNTENSLL